MTTTETNSLQAIAPAHPQVEYAQRGLSELQKAAQLDETTEHGTIVTLSDESESGFHATATVKVPTASTLNLNFLSLTNQILMKCNSEAEVSECLIRSTRELLISAQSEVWLYDSSAQRLRRSQSSDNLWFPSHAVEAVFATGEVRRGSLPVNNAELFYLCVPLSSGRQIFGACYLGSYNRAFSQDEKEVLQAIGHQAGAVLESLQTRNEQEQSCEKLIQALALTIDARDEITAGHSGRVANYSAAIARYMGLSKAEQRLIYYAGLLHDYGKVGVRDEVLCKPSSLTPEEFEEIKQHPEYTLSILSKIKFSEGLAEVPYVASCHHERPDGKGYPRGLYAGEIPIGALIIAVADVFDALTVKRHYRDPMPLDEVWLLLDAGRNTQFDGATIDAFRQFYEQEYLPRQHRYRK